MKPIITIALVAIVIVAALGTPVHAQSTDAANVRDFIDRNAELLDQATALVQQTSSTRARGLLETATMLQKQSVALLDQGSTILAARTAVRAREAIQQTIALAKRDARLEEQSTKTIEFASARLEQARTAFEDTGHDDANARRLILESGETLRRAREQMQEQMFETSLHLAQASVALSTRAIRTLRREVGDQDPSDEIDRTQRVIDRLSEVRGSLSPQLTQIADQATDMQSRATRSAERGDAQLAIEQTRAARDFALRALRAAGPTGESPQETAFRAVSMTDEILDGARTVASESSDDGLTRRIEDAAQQQENARRALESGDYDRAVRLTLGARESARAALRAAAGPVDPAAVEAALTRTDEVLARLRDAVDRSHDDDARALLQRATARQDEARRALADGEPRRALALSKVAFNLAKTALDRVGNARG